MLLETPDHCPPSASKAKLKITVEYSISQRVTLPDWKQEHTVAKMHIGEKFKERKSKQNVHRSRHYKKKLFGSA